LLALLNKCIIAEYFDGLPAHTLSKQKRNLLTPRYDLSVCQGCQIFLGTTDQNGKNIPKWTQNIPNAHKIPNGIRIDQMALKCTNIFDFKTLQNLPKLGFLV
jgi:hypothetical protein